MVNKADLLASGRHRRVVLARSLVVYLGREMTTQSFPEIAQALGRANHSTVHTADQRLRKQIPQDEMVDLGGDSRISLTTGKGWEFPDEAVIVKSFALEMREGDPTSKRWIETRLLTRQQGEWFGYSYAWNDEQTEATLVEGKGRDRPFAITAKAANIHASHSLTRMPRARTGCGGAYAPDAAPSAIHFNSLARSPALCQRSSGSFARHFLIARSSDGGVSG